VSPLINNNNNNNKGTECNAITANLYRDEMHAKKKIHICVCKTLEKGHGVLNNSTIMA
jgi:hypothetical protein